MARKLPKRNITAFSHWSATFIEAETITAVTKAIMIIYRVATVSAGPLYDNQAIPPPITHISMKISEAKALKRLMFISSII